MTLALWNSHRLFVWKLWLDLIHCNWKKKKKPPRIEIQNANWETSQMGFTVKNQNYRISEIWIGSQQTERLKRVKKHKYRTNRRKKLFYKVNAIPLWPALYGTRKPFLFLTSEQKISTKSHYTQKSNKFKNKNKQTNKKSYMWLRVRLFVWQQR